MASLALLASGIPGGVVSQVSSGIANVMRTAGASSEAVLAVTILGMVLGWVTGALIQYPVIAGAVIAAVRAQRGRMNDFGAILSGFRRFVPVVLTSLVVSVLSFAPMIPALLSFGPVIWTTMTAPGTTPDFSKVNVLGAVLFGLVGLVAYIWIYARCSVAVARVADPDLPLIGPIDAIRFSFDATRGNTLNAIGMFILTSTIGFLSLLLCCIGIVLVGVPLGLALQAGFYRALLREPDPTDSGTPQPWGGSAPPQVPI